MIYVTNVIELFNSVLPQKSWMEGWLSRRNCGSKDSHLCTFNVLQNALILLQLELLFAIISICSKLKIEFVNCFETLTHPSWQNTGKWCIIKYKEYLVYYYITEMWFMCLMLNRVRSFGTLTSSFYVRL